MVMKLLFQKKLDTESTIKVDMDSHYFFLKIYLFLNGKKFHRISFFRD